MVSANDAVLLAFHSPQSGPCRAIQPTLTRMAAEGLPIRQIDVTREPEMASRYSIRQTPTLVVMRGTREVSRLVGQQEPAKIRAALQTPAENQWAHTRATQQTRADQPTRATRNTRATIPSPRTRLVPLGGRPAEAMPSVDVALATERAQAATVRLRVINGDTRDVGTGTIIDTHGNEALVITCGHLFRESQGKAKIEADLFVGGQVRTVPAQVIDYTADGRDIALVAIRTDFAVQTVPLLAPEQRVRVGSPVFSFGCDNGDDPSRCDTRITGVDKYNQHLGHSNLEIGDAPVQGRSGGGLFDRSGNLIGVCNAAGYETNIGIYAGPGEIQWQLERAGLSHVYQSAPAPRSPRHQVAANTLPASANALASTKELIVIIRDADSGRNEMRTIANPSAELLRALRR
ncbi:MAG: trypsin-like peptidase domain-containing protein [Planctomycetota bacterium]